MIDPSFHGDNSPSTTEFIFVLDGDDGTVADFLCSYSTRSVFLTVTTTETRGPQ